MDNLKERLSAKLGPLPVWAWGIIAAVIAFVSYLYYKRSSTGIAGVVDPDSLPTIDAAGYQTAGIRGGSGTITSDEPDTNQKWLNRAAKAVADSMGVSPSEVYTALSKWLQGLDYTAREKQFVDKAIQLSMLPPEGTFGTGEVIGNSTDAIRNPNPRPDRPNLLPPIGIVSPRPINVIPGLMPAKGSLIPNTRVTPNIAAPAAPVAPAAPTKAKAPVPPPIMKAKGTGTAPKNPTPKAPVKPVKAIARPTTIKGKSVIA